MEGRTGRLSGGQRASGAYLLTGSLAGVNAAIPGYPVFAAQALRYTLATMVLAAACWVQGRRHPLDGPKIRLTRRVVWLLVLQATVGVTGFNYCTAEAVRHTGAATVGTVIAAVPVVLAIAGPLAARRRPAPRVIAGALLVAAGVALPIRAYFRRGGHPANGTAERGTTERGRYGGGAAAKPDADGGTACLAHIARTGAPRGAAPPHSVTIQVC